MSAPFTIRQALPADAGVLTELAERTFLETFGHLYTDADLSAFLQGAYAAAHQLRELEDPAWLTLLAEREGRPLGFAQVILGKDAPRGGLDAPVELNRFYLAREAQGTGLGNALMEAVLAAAVAQGGRTLWLGVWEHNARAQAFYARWGFAYAGEHVFKVGTHIDTDHILVRRLLPEP